MAYGAPAGTQTASITTLQLGHFLINLDFGESTLWTGTAIFAFNSLRSARFYPGYAGYLAFIAPVFVTFLTQFVSGTPMLEAKNDKELGEDCKCSRPNMELDLRLRETL